MALTACSQLCETITLKFYLKRLNQEGMKKAIAEWD